MPDTEDRLINARRYTASSYPTKLVWLLSFLALYTTLVMVIVVWWTLIDVRSGRERLDARKNELNAMHSMLDSRLENEKWDITALLDDTERPANPQSNRQLLALAEAYKKTTADPALNPSFDLLEKKISELLQHRNLCLRWSENYDRTQVRLPELEKKVKSILRQMDEAVSQAAGRKRLEWAVKIRRFRQSKGSESVQLARSIINDMANFSDLTSTSRDINDLSLLYERLLHEDRPDHLHYLKDNNFLTVLSRLQLETSETGRKPDDKGGLSPSLLEEFIASLFGKGYKIDTEHQTLILGAGENLFQTCLNRVNENLKKAKLRQDLLQISTGLHETVQQIADLSDVSIRQDTVVLESAIKRALHIILIVGVATGTIFLAISYKIILEIRGQIKAIEDTNIILDKRTKALSKSEEALRQSEERLQFLSSNLLTAQENERLRISRELHDELGQSMAALKLQVGVIERRFPEYTPDKMRKECENIRQHINEIIENVRRLSKDLSPVVIDDLGLEAAIDYLVSNFAKLNKMRFSLDLPDINPLFSQESQRLIYRIIQEALANISKHAGASHLTITAERKERMVSFTISDDGVGFDLEKVISKRATEKGMGLTTMAERVRILGGSIDFRSN
ncbi:MAG: sensor histidine kinase, partial [Deltaproteobacteria bacterium]